MDDKFTKLYKKIEKCRNSKVIAYVTGDRVGLEANINFDVIDLFGKHLESFGKRHKISLILYTLGGTTMATWNIVNLIKEYCDELEIIVPRKARSAGTIMCLGANSIILTRQSTLGPIDPSLSSPLCPKINANGQVVNLPVSVESVKGYFNLAKKELNIVKSDDLIKAFIKLSETINPLLIGDIYRSQGQIKMIANRLLESQNMKKRQKKKIVDFLCSDSGSHDYAINYSEAKELGLNVSLADDELNSLINEWYQLITSDMELNNVFNAGIELSNVASKQYCFVRAVLDSYEHGRYQFVSKGFLQKLTAQTNQIQISDTRTFEGWEKA